MRFEKAMASFCILILRDISRRLEKLIHASEQQCSMLNPFSFATLLLTVNGLKSNICAKLKIIKQHRVHNEIMFYAMFVAIIP